MDLLVNLFDPVFLNSLFRFMTPIFFAALGGALCERVGIVNINLEGQMLMGSFGAVLGSYFLQSAFLGILAAMAFSMFLALIFAVLRINFGAGEIIVGLALNLLGTSLTIFLLRTIFDVTGTFSSPDLVGLKKLSLPLVRDVPVLGPLFSGHTALVYFSWLVVVLLQLLLFSTSVGLRMRGVGEHPKASATLGVSVTKIQYLAVLLSGALCGLAGAQLSLGNVTMFVQNMTGGRGWIAIVANMLGQAHPLGVMGSSLLFGFVSSLSFRVQGMGWPQEITEMMPYVITLISLVIVYMISQKNLRRGSKETGKPAGETQEA